MYGIFVLFSLGAVIGLFTRGHKNNVYFTYIPAIIASFLTIVLSFLILFSEPIQVNLFNILHLFNFEILIDGVSAFFLFLIGLISFAVSIYSLSYSKKLDDKKNNSSLGLFFNIFIISMILVIISNDVFFFLIFWELMSLISFFLVIFEHENKNNVNSGLTYLVMTHFGTGVIFLSFLLLYSHTGSFSFDSFRDIGLVPQHIKDIVFVLVFVGFGTKAGIVPLHIWLPKAHPSAPSNVSALMSAVMLKIPIYGIIRYLFDFNSIDTQDYVWWGIGMMVVGSISALVGVLYALIENDIKRALAFSSIENIGIIFIGLGLSVVFASFNLMSLSIISFVAAMFHTLNHSIFKGLLFMAAGSIHYSTHTTNIDDLGGLIKKMPWTALMFLVGSIAITGLPPLNGFISEWLTFQSLISIFQIPSSIFQVVLAFTILVFALTIGLVVATFVKLFGIAFLSNGQSSKVTDATEVPRFMLVGKSILALLCVLFGILPFIGLNFIVQAFDLSYIPLNPFEPISIKNTSGDNFASLMMPAAIIIFISVFAGVFVFVRIIGGKTKTTKYGTWDCGFGSSSERTRYTATSLTEPIRRIFGVFYKPRDNIEHEFYSEENKYLKKTSSVYSITRNIFDELLYEKVTMSCLSVLDKIRRIHTGKINAYILYIMITLLALLAFTGFGING
ncbi:MAG: hydrogenase 4 subunit B [Nitrososphaeraceae archaeon]|nr:hydrogenase 4 subunit B [Nitrososphaeraceae archaeon]